MLCKALIIDTRKELSTKYKKSLTDKDIEVQVARSIQDGFGFIQSLEPDLIIVSITLSGLFSSITFEIILVNRLILKNFK